MKAIIFNSGLGKRMGELTHTQHKSMARLGNGETIFGRQLRLLAAAGVKDIVVTSGPFAEQLHAESQAPHLSGIKFTFVENKDYESTNYIYSMYLAREHLDDDLLMLHGDLVFNVAALKALLEDARADLGMVDTVQPQPEKDFKARVVDGVIQEVSVSISDENCYAFQPLYKLSRRAINVWVESVVDFVERGDVEVYAENALNKVMAEAHIEAFSYVEHSVNEVDTPEDLSRVSAEIRLFDFAEQPVLAEPNDYQQIPSLLRHAGARKPLLVGGQSFEGSFIRSFLDESGLDFVRFTGYSANPKLEEVKAGLKVFLDEGCDSIVSVGGGSAIDVAKCIQILAAADSEDFPAFGAALSRRIPHLCVPTSAGTGSESTHFAVVYIDGEKNSIAHDVLVPDWVILEPRLLESLPEYHKKSALLDAFSQCIESSWAASATEESIGYAMQGIRLIVDNFFPYFHKGGFDEAAARSILIAANFGGKAINLTKTTAPHAMSYKMTELYGLAHGHAVALCLVGVWRYFNKLVTDRTPEGLAVEPALDRIATALETSRSGAVDKLAVMLQALQMPAPALGGPDNLDLLVASVNQERLGNSPVPLSADEIKAVYEFVFGLRPEPFSLPVHSNQAEADPYLPTREKYDNLAKLQSYELGILRSFDEFCTREGLRYYLSEGSMLGAVRHGGMIPWDDDIDVMMPREDYRRLVAFALEGKLPDRCALDCFETNQKQWVFGAKLPTTETTEFHIPPLENLATFNGPYIDIFPVDSVAKPYGPKFAVQKLLLRGLRRLLFMSAGRSRRLRKKPLVRIPLYALTKLVRTTTIHRWIIWAQSKFNSAPDAAHWANLCSYYPLDRQVFPREWFGDGKRIAFEGQTLPVPIEVEQMVAQIYGANYAAIPPLKVLRSRPHSIKTRTGPDDLAS